MNGHAQDLRSEDSESALEGRSPTLFPVGPVAALLTPRTISGQIDERAFTNNLELVRGGGMRGVCVGGATGEYVRVAAEEKTRLLTLARRVVADHDSLLCGAGAAELEECVASARRAFAAGATVVLLPPPHFYRYGQDDIEAFYDEAARRIEGPVLLYNLPAFTNAVEEPLALRLIERVPNVIGIKDSSGSLQILRALSEPTTKKKFCRMVGNDAVLREALETRTCDGAVSGVAGVLPELIAALFASHAKRDATRYDFLGAALNELLLRLDAFPTPWGLKLIAETRELGAATFPTPLSAARIEQVRDFQSWFGEWWGGLQAELR